MSFNKNERKFPYEIKSVDAETNEELLKYFHGERTEFVQVGPQKYLFPCKYREFAESFYNFQARPDDIWIATFPRSGTTWTQELVWLITNNLDFETAQMEPLTKRFPFFEVSNCIHKDLQNELIIENSENPEMQKMIEDISQPGYIFLNKMEHQRFIKTHFPFSLLPPSVMEQKCKLIYIARNPKDVAVSFYHLNRMSRAMGYNGDFAKYWDFFERGLNSWGPYWSHINEGWTNRHHPNVLFMFYEDMSTDFPATIRKVGKFLGKSLTDEQVKNLAEYLDINNFKNNKAVNGKELNELKIFKSGEGGFIRNGTINGWQSEYTPELRARAEKWIADKLGETDLRFPKFI